MPANPIHLTTLQPVSVLFPFDVERKFQTEVRPGRLVSAAEKVGDLLDRFESDKLPVRKIIKILENDIGLRKRSSDQTAFEQLLIGLSFIKPMDPQKVDKILSRMLEISSKLLYHEEDTEMYFLTMMGAAGVLSLIMLSAGSVFINHELLFFLGIMPLKMAMRPLLKKILDDFVQRSNEVESHLRKLLRTNNPSQDHQREWLSLREELALISRQMRELIHASRWIWKDVVFKYTLLILEVNCPAYEKRIQEIEGILAELPDKLGTLDDPYR